MTVKEFWESKDKLAIHCDTKEKADKLLAKFNELGKKWRNNINYIDYTHYKDFLDQTCYDNGGCYARKKSYASKGFYEKDYQVIEFDDLDDFKQKKQKDVIMKEENKTDCKFKVGDIVKVVDDGCPKYVRCRGLKKGREAIVRSVGEYGSVPAVLLCAIETLEGDVFIIDETGLKLIEEKR